MQLKFIFVIFCIICSIHTLFADRVISIGPGTTEIIYALGVESNLVGNCASSNYPIEANDIPKVGYQRILPSEGIISLYPNIVFLTDQAGPKSVIHQLEKVNIDVVYLKSALSLEDLFFNIQTISSTLGIKKGDNLIDDLKSQHDVLKERLLLLNHKPTVLFILGHGGVNRVAGKNTAANSMIELSGGVNVINEFEGYKPISSEYYVEFDPDYILTTTLGIDAEGGMDKFKNLPGIKETRAVKNNNIIIFDAQYLLGFGPRVIDAALDLNSRLYQ